METPLLCEVEYVLNVRKVGQIILPGIPVALPFPVTVGALIVIETPAGARLETHIAAFELIHRTGEARNHRPFSVKGIAKDQIPVGSRVYMKLPAVDQAAT